MSKVFTIVAGLLILASCRSREIIPGGLGLRTIVASMERLDRPKDFQWVSKNVELTCHNDAGSTVLYAHKYSEENDEDNFHFEPSKVISNATCRLKIKIFEKQTNFDKYIWLSIPEDPGLLYISDEAPLQGGKIELKVYKAFQLKTPKKTKIAIGPKDCYADFVGDECPDLRAVEFPSNLGAWWAVIYGRAVQDQNTKQQIIVSMRQGPVVVHKKFGITIDDIVEDLNKPESQQVFGYFKIGAKEKLETLPFDQGYFETAELSEAKIPSFQNFKPLHIAEVKGWGFQIVEKAYLDAQKSAHWFVAIEAEKDNQIVTALLGGIEPNFLSSQKPLAGKYYDDKQPFPTPLDTSKFYKAFRSARDVVMVSSCGQAIDRFLEKAEWSHHLASKTVLLPGTCEVVPNILNEFYKDDWEISHEYWLESWHNVF